MYVTLPVTVNLFKHLKQVQSMEVQKKKTAAKDLSLEEKVVKPQGQLPKTTWQVNPEDASKSRWNPSALYF